jgi:hypothetical protein
MKNMLLSLALLTCVATASAAIKVTGAAYLNGEKLDEQEYVLEANRINVDLGDSHTLGVTVTPSEDDELVTLEVAMCTRAEDGTLEESANQQATVHWGQETIFKCPGVSAAELHLKAVRE